jgi:FtsP/CotA-like multicopper oxidase with cupredoxin domain
MDRLSRWPANVSIALGFLLVASWHVSLARAQGSIVNPDPAIRSDFSEPVMLTSKDGVLEVALTAHQGHARLDTVATPVQNFLVFAYRVVRGTSSNGQMSGDNLYPPPTLQAYPGETLIVHMNNALTGLTIRDYFNPAYTAKGKEVPLYPEQMTSSPLNLHIHGVHISPKGNSDNVMLHISAGMSNTYIYHIPKDMPQGAYWYHSHLHTLTTGQTYYGLAGLLAIGRTDGNLPVVTANHIPIRNMILQYNGVFDRAGGLAQLNNLFWPQFVSTLAAPKGSQLANGTYRPLMVPVNFMQSRKGTQYLTVWYSGPLSIGNKRGLFQIIPSNLQHFTADPGQPGSDLPANPQLPDYRRDVQFTVNGEFEPTTKIKPGQTEIWVLANISDVAYMNVELTETATGKHPPIAIVGQDGNPSPAVHYPITHNGTQLLIPPATRVAIAVTMPATGDLQLEMPPLDGGKTQTARGILYTNDGTANPPAVLGTLSVAPTAISYLDGFFAFPTQVLVKAVAAEGKGLTTAFVERQPLQAYTSFEDLSHLTPNVQRQILISGGFLNEHASKSDPKSFVYSFDNNAFPNVPLIQPRLGSVEEWTFTNTNNDEHPIHVHVNDFQVTKSFDPTAHLRTEADMWGEDNANVPAPLMDEHENTIEAGTLSMRTKFVDYTGLYVMHCHRLNHEDNGLMSLINVIPAVSTYAVAVPGSPGHSAVVKIYDGNGDRLIATVTPFPGFEGSPSVAMGDIDGDNVLDLVVGAGKDHSPEVVVYSGVPNRGKAAFETELTRFMAFPSSERGGVNVAATQIDGSSADNIIVGSGPGIPDQVKVFDSHLPSPLGTAPAIFSTLSPYPDDRSGVSVAAGIVDFMSGRYSIVTAPGPGARAQIKVFDFSLMTPIDNAPKGDASMEMHQSIDVPMSTAEFTPFGDTYKGGVSLATGWLTGAFGGAQSIVVSQLTGDGAVKVYSSGSALDGLPMMYLSNPAHDDPITFNPVADFSPFAGSSGARVATTSTTYGADLLVSGVTPGNKEVQVIKYRLARPSPSAVSLQAVREGEVESASGSQPYELGGN